MYNSRREIRDIWHRVKEVEKQANAGPRGAQRRQYCKDYRRLQQEICAEALTDLSARVASDGKSITCRRGCTYCCLDYVSIPIAQGIVIVDYLYADEERIRKFFAGYERWQHRLEIQPASVPVMQSLDSLTSFSPIVQPTPQKLLKEYFNLCVPCAFLAGTSCLIYPVRPISCSAYLALSPPAQCAPGSPRPSLMCQAIPSLDGLRRLKSMGEPELTQHEETMPVLINRLLTEGLPEVMMRLKKLNETTVNERSWAAMNRDKQFP